MASGVAYPMNACKLVSSLSRCRCVAVVLILLAVAAYPANAAPTVWTGPTIPFVHTQAQGGQDTIIPGAVVITRGALHGLYNAATEPLATAGVSPLDTEWAIGSLANYNTLTNYGSCPLEQ